MVDEIRLPLVILSEAEPKVRKEKTEGEPITPTPSAGAKRARARIPPTGKAPIGPRTEKEGSLPGEFVRETGKFIGRHRAMAIGGGVKAIDRISKAPVQRESTFRQMQNQLKQQAAELKAQRQTILDNIGRIEKAESLVGKAGQFVADPAGSVSNTVLEMLGGLGPKGKLALAAIGAAVAVPETIKQIIKILGTKGLPLNRDWERNLGGNATAFFSLDENKRRLIGEDAYVITQQARFEPDSGSETFNSLANRDEVLISRIGNRDKALGIEY